MNRQHLIAGSICFSAFLIFYALTSRVALQTSDETAVFTSGVSFAIRGTLAIDELEWLDEHVNLGQRGPDGHLYTKYFPGNVFGVALIYKLTARANDQPYIGPYNGVMEFAPSVTGAQWALRINALWGALGMTALLFSLRKYFDWRTAVFAVFLIGVCSDWWFQSRGLFSEVGAGAFLIASLCFAIYEKPVPSALALAISILFRPTNLLALPILIWALRRKRKISEAIISAAVLGAGCALLALYNYVRFGSVLRAGYANDIFSVPFWTGLHCMFLTPGRSLFVYSPVVLLAIPGAWIFFPREKVLSILCAAIALGYAIVIAKLAPLGWGLSWGARLLIPVVPLLALLMAPVLDLVWTKKWIAAVALLLAILGADVQMLGLLRDPHRVLVEEVASGNTKYEETLYTARNCWVALQIRSLREWAPCDIDALTLRRWFTICSD